MSAELTRNEIRDVATEMFCRHGYRGSTLQGIGAAVGLTRGSVLHHFSSKAQLLAAVTTPYLAALEELLSRAEATGTPREADRAGLVRELADLLVEHRGAVRVLANDVAAQREIGLDAELWRSRLVKLLFGNDATAADEIRAAAALGALSVPIAADGIDVEKPDLRNALVNAARRAAGTGTAAEAAR